MFFFKVRVDVCISFLFVLIFLEEFSLQIFEELIDLGE